MSGRIGVPARAYICILLILGVLFQDESQMTFRGKVRGMAQEDDSDKNSCSSPNGENGDGSKVSKGKSISTRRTPRKARPRGSDALHLEKEESVHHFSPSPSQSRSLDPVLPVNPNSDLAKPTDWPLNCASTDMPGIKGIEELANSLRWVHPPPQAQGNVNCPRPWNYNWDLFCQHRFPMNSTCSAPGLYYRHPHPMESFPSANCSSSPSSTSSLMGFMEPPSNQIKRWQPRYQGNGKKRPYPLSTDSAISDYKEATQMQRVINKENKGSFLSLAPPGTASANLRFRPYNVETVDFGSLPYQDAADRDVRDQIFIHEAFRRTRRQPVRIYRGFSPPALETNEQATTSQSNGGSNGGGGGEGEEGLDLELRLRPAKPNKQV
ncbi:PREDICTED: uncharacterized protein LOC104798751 [Tarenaya hassleriana]|uniref:uncharacterized protein LOC104798751 n=1 Tax=Tarenaya hassleriana TaxID=28532 RepID=UPI00053C84D0|nr:PREDICTED: uncharacterized protein LOC104798751 [Tarenaya hassleriana]